MSERQGTELAKRRFRIYAGRISNMVLRRGIKQKCLFLHLPKCGGTSLSEALYATVPMHKHIGVIDAISSRRAASIMDHNKDCILQTHEDLDGAASTFALREQMMIAYMCAEYQLIHGHVFFSDKMWEHFGQAYKIVTVMRDPVKRALSNFRMNVANGVHSADADEWLDGVQGRNHASVNLRYLSGQADIKAGDEKVLLPKAMEALDKVALVGILEEMDVFLDRFEEMFGARPKMHRYNLAKGERLELSDSQMARLRELCAPDIALYDAAYKKWGKASS